ncbi:hypothetical protein ASPFODRAFT_75778 [Aspergillus luchuensis CBS 106.47]|uniref:Uncharacterized protein n=1 Tax=Aspergillus luchuensis (strain CBS 106.47) TaxID=1137211 RepID=A0A1M3T1S5_ASPLC|nr:hypothetical protein ASPFODRAFT_75778 [Aspergillus luchuensis CBS 106.47]
MSIMLLLTLPVRHPRSFPCSFFLSFFLLFPSSYYYYIIVTAVLPCHFDLSKPLLRPACNGPFRFLPLLLLLTPLLDAVQTFVPPVLLGPVIRVPFSFFLPVLCHCSS